LDRAYIKRPVRPYSPLEPRRRSAEPDRQQSYRQGPTMADRIDTPRKTTRLLRIGLHHLFAKQPRNTRRELLHAARRLAKRMDNSLKRTSWNTAHQPQYGAKGSNTPSGNIFRFAWHFRKSSRRFRPGPKLSAQSKVLLSRPAWWRIYAWNSEAPARIVGSSWRPAIAAGCAGSSSKPSEMSSYGKRESC